jgi:WD40 repeat protein
MAGAAKCRNDILSAAVLLHRKANRPSCRYVHVNVLVSLADGSVTVWKGHFVNVQSLTYGQDGTLYSTDIVGNVVSWSADGKPWVLAEPENFTPNQAWNLRASPGGDALAVITDGSVRLLSSKPAPLRSTVIANTPANLRHFPQAFTFLPDGKGLVSGGEDGRVLVWSVPALELSRAVIDPALAKAK